MSSHDAARTPPAANKAKSKVADRSRDRAEVRLERAGKVHARAQHVTMHNTHGRKASQCWMVHSCEAGKYPRPTNVRRPECFRAAQCKRNEVVAQKLSAVRLGAACFVLRASCFVLRAAGCGLRGPVAPYPQISQISACPNRGSIPVPPAFQSDHVATSATDAA